MFTTKKAQYMSPEPSGSNLWVWFMAFIFLFALIVIYFTFTKPFIAVDDAVSPLINMTVDGKDAQEVVSKIRTYWLVWPLLIAVGLVLWAFMSSLKQDPNHPYQ